ncbi:MAG: HD-GYP domain-containing protein [Acidobacteriota bacterium]
MTDRGDRLERYEEVIHRLSGALRAARMYSTGHPRVVEQGRALLDAVEQLHRTEGTILIGFLGGEVIADDMPLLRASASRAEFIRDMRDLGIHRVIFERGLTAEEVQGFVHAVASGRPEGRPSAAPGSGADPDIDFLVLPHLRAGRIPVDAQSGRWGSSVVSARQTYSGSIESARAVWDNAMAEGRADVTLACDTVEHLAGALGESQGLMIGLTGMKSHDEYTFTHMVNVAILTMAQARSLGIDGQRLRAIGLAGLMHDIGKVKTPLDILAKPGVLTAREFEIMRRHPIEGAEILRATAEMPPIAPIVAFEHHLRTDGTGYPVGLHRASLNLATQLVGIADVYDAMRSKRSYQQAFPTDRIIEVMRRNDGKQFDQNLVRRFIDLMGVYPPGSVVRLTTGEIAVVIENDGPDPSQPTVKVLRDALDRALPTPQTRSLWKEALDDQGDEAGPSIIEALDPAAHHIDALSLLAAS